MLSVSELTILETPDVRLLDWMGDDADICDAARVSSDPDVIEAVHKTDSNRGLINYLTKHKHGTPFEHAALKFYVSAPIFVFREFHRHRIGFSYNEMSGRYTELPSEFYVPNMIRPLVNFGSSAHPVYRVPRTPEEIQTHGYLHEIMREDVMEVYELAWVKYQHMLGAGIAKEVARIVLPVGIYSRMYVTCNPRSLMNFLSLRIEDEKAMFVSHPQYEIQQVALKLEEFFKYQFPMTYEAYIANGRVAP